MAAAVEARGIALGTTGAILSSENSGTLGAPLTTSDLAEATTGAVGRSVAQQLESLEVSIAALRDVDTQHQNALAIASDISNIGTTLRDQPPAELRIIASAIVSARELQTKLESEVQPAFSKALQRAGGQEDIPATLAPSLVAFGEVISHTNSYLDRVRQAGERLLAGEAIDNRSRLIIETALGEMHEGFRGAGLKMDHPANSERFASMRERLIATIDESFGVIDAAAVRALHDELIPQFSGGGLKSKAGAVFTEKMESLAQAADAHAASYAQAREALASIGGKIIERYIPEGWRVGAADSAPTPQLDSDALAALGISDTPAQPPTPAEMNALIARAELISRGLPLEPADMLEENPLKDLVAGNPSRIYRKDNVEISTREYKRGDETVGRDIILRNTKLDVSIVLRADYDYVSGLGQENGFKHTRDGEYRKKLAQDSERAYEEFAAAIRGGALDDSTSAASTFVKLCRLEGSLGTNAFRVEVHQSEKWTEATTAVVQTSIPAYDKHQYYQRDDNLRDHLVNFARGGVTYRYEARNPGRSGEVEMESFVIDVQPSGVPTVILNLLENSDRKSGKLKVEINGIMRDSRDVDNMIHAYTESLKEGGVGALTKTLLYSEIVEAKNLDLADRTAIKLKLGSPAAISNVSIRAPKVEIASDFILDDRKAELRKEDEFNATIHSVTVDAERLQLDLGFAILADFTVNDKAITRGKIEHCHFRRCSIPGDDTSLSYSGKNTFDGCKRSKWSFGSQIVPEKR